MYPRFRPRGLFQRRSRQLAVNERPGDIAVLGTTGQCRASSPTAGRERAKPINKKRNGKYDTAQNARLGRNPRTAYFHTEDHALGPVPAGAGPAQQTQTDREAATPPHETFSVAPTSWPTNSGHDQASRVGECEIEIAQAPFGCKFRTCPRAEPAAATHGAQLPVRAQRIPSANRHGAKRLRVRGKTGGLACWTEGCNGWLPLRRGGFPGCPGAARDWA